MGEEVGTMQFWSSRGANKKNLMRKKKMRKIKKEQKYEYEKKGKEKNMSMYDIKIK
jgi:hypothetical protein